MIAAKTTGAAHLLVPSRQVLVLFGDDSDHCASSFFVALIVGLLFRSRLFRGRSTSRGRSCCNKGREVEVDDFDTLAFDKLDSLAGRNNERLVLGRRTKDKLGSRVQSGNSGIQNNLDRRLVLDIDETKRRGCGAELDG